MLDYPFMRRGEMCAFLTFRSRKSAIFQIAAAATIPPYRLKQSI